MGDIHLENHANDNADDGIGEALVAKHKVNRPGYEAAIKGAQRQMNYPNAEKGSEKGSKGYQCFRCGSKDHFARDCNLPWSKAAAFPTTKGVGRKSGKSTGKGSVYLASEGAEENRLLEDDNT